MKKLLLAGATVAVSVGLVSGISTAAHGPNEGLCYGERPTIVADNGGGTTRGTPGDDVIKGRNGPDRILGRGGDDKLCGNKGTDRIIGNGGGDKMHGGHANDDLIGKNGFDRANGKTGNDICRAERKKKCEA